MANWNATENKKQIVSYRRRRKETHTETRLDQEDVEGCYELCYGAGADSILVCTHVQEWTSRHAGKLVQEGHTETRYARILEPVLPRMPRRKPKEPSNPPSNTFRPK